MINYKKIMRLKNFNYKGRYRYLITICTYKRKSIFKSDSLVKWLIKILREKSNSYGFKVWAYCFMPDHLHLLIEGRNSDSDMRKFISSYKQYTGFYYKKNSDFSLWQINFYEHVLRNEENTISVAYYIFNNPVRKGLVDDYKQYKYIGSFEFDVIQM